MPDPGGMNIPNLQSTFEGMRAVHWSRLEGKLVSNPFQHYLW
jgi:hypothetical protein